MPEIKSVMNLSTDLGRALANQILEQQASIMAYAADFRLLTLYVFCALPLTLLLDSSRSVMSRKAAIPPSEPPA
jgi:DHA2 family multidrug resistance protein